MTYPIGTAANMVALALAEVGYVEKPTNRVKYKGEAFEHAWCGDFQDWLCKQNNMKMPSQRSTVLGFNKMRDIGRGVTDKPQIGDWVYMGWGAKGEIQHIGLLWVMGFLVTFLFGGITGIILASPPLDFAVSASYFVVAHFHHVLS